MRVYFSVIGQFYVAILIMFSSCVMGDDDVEEITEEIFHAFEMYRSDISSDRSSLGKYFSKEVNEIWLAWLLEEVGAEELLTTQLAIKNRAAFGLRVKKIYDYRVEPEKDGIMVLNIIYEAATGGKYYTYEIGYIMRSDRWLIRWVKNDVTKPGAQYSGEIVREF